MDPDSWAGKRDDNTLPEDQIAEEMKIYNETVEKVTQAIRTINDLYATIPLAKTMRQATLELLEVTEELERLEITLPHVGCGPHV
jgi:Lon protease-like protein